MLSRIAEAMYWMGRHVERADNTARIVDTYLHLLPTGAWKQENQIVRELVESMGLASETPSDPDLLIRALVFDGDRPSSVAGALIAASVGLVAVLLVTHPLWGSGSASA